LGIWTLIALIASTAVVTRCTGKMQIKQHNNCCSVFVSLRERTNLHLLLSNTGYTYTQITHINLHTFIIPFNVTA